MDPERLFAIYQSCTGVRLSYRNITPGDMFFGVKIHEPTQPRKKIVWKLICLLEMRSPLLLSWLYRAGRWTPWADELRWAASMEMDGNAFAHLAIQRGASYAVVDNPNVVRGERYILVENATAALQKLASTRRNKMRANLIAITGSSGKTTTTALVNAVLATTYKIPEYYGGANDLWSMPLRLLLLPEDSDLMVFEVSAIKRRMMANQCRMLKPNFGLITNVGEVHLNTFGSVEAVAQGKKELYDHLEKNGGQAFINDNDPRVRAMAGDLSNPWTYGSSRDCRTVGESLPGTFPLAVRWYPNPEDRSKFIDIQSNLFGEHNLDNVLATIAVGTRLGVSPEKIKIGIEGLDRNMHRSFMGRSGSNLIIVDDFHGTEMSTRALLHSFSKLHHPNRIAILSDMDFRYRSISARKDSHGKIIDLVGELGFEKAVYVGRAFYAFRKHKSGHFLPGHAEYMDWVKVQSFENAAILLRGNHAFYPLSDAFPGVGFSTDHGP